MDLESGNGTIVNDRRVTDSALANGDVITLGDSTFRFGSARTHDTFATLLEIPIPASEADVDREIESQSLVYTLPDTSVPRLAIRLPPDTWEVPIVDDALTIGRTDVSDIVIPRPEVSRQHAVVERRGKDVWIRDLASSNGTWIDGKPVTEARLATGTEARIGPATLVFKAAFGPDDLTLVDRPSTAGRPKPKPKQRIPVVFVPGFMGSEMWDQDRLLWPNVHAALADPEIYRWPERPLEARSVLKEHVIVPNFISLARYSRLVDYLEEELAFRTGEDLLPFPYDWRQDNRASARELAEAIRAWRTEKGHDQVAIVAHSMGCLISRYYIEQLGGAEHVRRSVLIGGLNSGSPKTFQAFLGARGLFAFNQLRARFQNVVASFPSVYQSLPTNECVVDDQHEPVDFFADDSWLPEVHRPYLKDAKAFFAELGTTTSVPTVCVFGYGLKTPARLVVERDETGAWKGGRFEVEERGDDTIPQESAAIEGADIHPVQQHHGVLYTDADVQMRLRIELVAG